MVTCIKQRLSNIWSSIHEKVKQHWGWVETKRCLYKKVCSLLYRKKCFEGVYEAFVESFAALKCGFKIQTKDILLQRN